MAEKQFRERSRKIYIVKNLSPWMMDELLAFSEYTAYTLILLREPESKYLQSLTILTQRDVQVLTRPFRFTLSLRRFFFCCGFIVSNPAAFLSGYSAVVGWKSIAWFMRLDLREIPDHSTLHAQFATQAALIALFLNQYRKGRISYSFTFHAYDIYFNNQWFAPLVNQADQAFSISGYNIKYVAGKFEGVDTVKLAISRLGAFLPDNAGGEPPAGLFTIGFMGLFVEKKGVIYLLKAMEVLQQRDCEVRLLLAGEGPLTKSYQDFINEANLRHVSIIGPVHGEAKDNFFKSIHAFVMPSVRLADDMDGIPVVLMETLSYHLPMIATDISGMAEICLHDYNGLLIPERDVNALADAITFMAEQRNEYDKFCAHSAEVLKQYDIRKNSYDKLTMLNWL